MTGGTAGLGQVAAQRVSAMPDARLLVGTRTAGSGTGEALPLDLSRLASVREFARAVTESAPRLDALADDATVVITTSDTHDPRTNSFAAPRDLDPELLAHPSGRGGFVAGFRAWRPSSKPATRSSTSRSTGPIRRPDGSTPRWSSAASPGRTRPRWHNATT